MACEALRHGLSCRASSMPTKRRSGLARSDPAHRTLVLFEQMNVVDKVLSRVGHYLLSVTPDLRQLFRYGRRVRLGPFLHAERVAASIPSAS